MIFEIMLMYAGFLWRGARFLKGKKSCFEGCGSFEIRKKTTAVHTKRGERS